MNQHNRWANMFRIGLRVAGILLILTGAAKAAFALGEAPILRQPDPLLGIPNRPLFLLVGLFELVLGIGCLTVRHATISIWGVAIIATNFLLYRLGLEWVDFQGPCNCLGSLSGLLGVSDRSLGITSNVILIWLLVVGYGGIWRLLRSDKAGRADGLAPS